MIGITLGLNGLLGSGDKQYAMRFNGTTQYFGLPLPSEMFTNGTFETGVNTYNWLVDGTWTWNDTETGKTGNYCAKGTGASAVQIYKNSILTVGKSYKLAFRYKAGAELALKDGQSGTTLKTFPATTEWNKATCVFTATTTNIAVYTNAADLFLDDISLKLDQKLDLNKDQEMILHSKNWNFEGATVDWAAAGNHALEISATDKYEGTQSLKVTASAAGDASNCVALPALNMEGCVEANKYTLEGFARLDPTILTYGSNLVTNATDWTDDNADGLANNWILTIGSGTQSPSVIDGTVNGFSGNVQRLECTSNLVSGGIYVNVTTQINKIYKIQYSVRSNVTIKILMDASVLVETVPSTSDVKTDRTVYFLAPSPRTSLRFYFFNNDYTATTGQYFEIDNVSVIEATPPVLYAVIGSKSVTLSVLSIIAGTFTKFVLNFEATAGEVAADFKLYLSGAGAVYIDKLSLTQGFDFCAIQKLKNNDTGNFALWSKTTENGTIAGLGYSIWGTATRYYFDLFSEAAGAGAEYSVDKSTLADGVWNNIVFKINRTLNVQNGNQNALSTQGTTNLGKVIPNNSPFFIAAFTTTYFLGFIANIQFLRFTNIGLSTFNPTTHTFPTVPTGGGAEEVLRLDWKGANFAAAIKDKSPVGNDLTAYNMDITNREVVI